MATTAASSTGSTPPSGPAPTSATDRRTGAAAPPSTPSPGSWPDEAYKGWASL